MVFQRIASHMTERMVWNNILRMLIDRGVPAESTRHDAETYNIGVMLLPSPPPRANSQTLVCMDRDHKVGIDTVRKLLSLLNQRVPHIVFVVRDKITPFAQQAIESFLNEHMGEFAVEIFNYREMCTRVVDHHLTPALTILHDTERARVVKVYGDKVDAFPKLRHSDPLAKHFGLRPGTVVQLRRKFTMEAQHLYRIVV